MNDTHPKIAELVIELMQKKTPYERLLMSSSMHATSKFLVMEAIKRNHPNISPAKMRQEIFLKFYGDDFSEEQKEKILIFLATHDPECQK